MSDHENTGGTEGSPAIDAGFESSPELAHDGTEGTITLQAPLECVPATPDEPEIRRPCYLTHDDYFRANGKLHAPGLYYHGWSKARDPEPVDIRVCTPIHVEAITSNERGQAFGRQLRFLDSYGKWREWAAPMALLRGSGEELRGELLSLGAVVFHHEHFNLWLKNERPRGRMVAALRTGWHETQAGRAFVMPNRVIGAGSIRFQSEHAAHDDFAEGGSLDAWRDGVSVQCRGNPILLLAVSAAFAGPLLKVAKLQEVGGFGIHLVGDSSKGKTTALQCAASVWGAPGFVRTWRATSNGLEATAAALNDTLLTLDEISECDPREIGAIVYALANGAGKQRAHRTGGMREAARWRIIALSSGERTLEAHMSEAGKRIKAGQVARLLDVPATTRAHGAFDLLHGCESGPAFADSLKRATGKSYGYAGPCYVEHLIRDSRNLSGWYSEACEKRSFAASDGIKSRAAGVFALLGIAGELATEYGITGWGEGEAMAAAVDAFNTWASFRGEGQTEAQQILGAVRDFIFRHGESRFISRYGSVASESLLIRDRAGFWEDSDQGRVFLMPSATLREAAPGFDLRRIIDALDAAGWIAEHDSGKRSKKVKVSGSTVNLFAVRPDEAGE